jgi:EmrB/QacA subfamily drug resistance transporter
MIWLTKINFDRKEAMSTTALPASGPATGSSPEVPGGPMSHRAVLQALSGLLLGMFVAILASTVVSNSLPRIIGDLGGNQTGYTWVVTSTLLATTVTTPIWGKFADLFSRKLLIQLALAIFVIGSALAGFSQNTEMLIGFRVVQGLGAGGLQALAQIIMADIISPRDRGRYMGLLGGVMAVGTVGGPLIGGLITDGIGWRWNFYVGVPVAIIAIIVLQFTLKLPKRPPRKVSIDYLGAILIAGGVSLLLIWVSLAGQKGQFDWVSVPSFLMVGGAVVALGLAVLTEFKAKEPIIPMSLFKNPTFVFSTIASIAVGIAMFGSSVFLAQYMQLARGATPTESGLLTLPMIVGLLGSSIIAGQLISRFGKWKAFVVSGSVLFVAGVALMSTIAYDTPYPLLAVYMFVFGAGVGMVMQNLVLVVQNTVKPEVLGSASSTVTFFRSLGGAIGVSVLGSVLSSRITTLIADRQQDLQAAIEKLGAAGAKVAQALGSGSIPEVSTLPPSVRVIIESAYGHGVASVFLVALPIAAVAVIAVALLPNKPLGRKNAVEQLQEQQANGTRHPGLERAEESAFETAEALVAAPPTGSVELPSDDAGVRSAR